mmetsp:Transcript_102422/g.330392  ORF Transcript_102422/g.330392 Transcript_102422/m.330392 type:complete len:369 (-) Transcript_102422:1941-3047(-)
MARHHVARGTTGTQTVLINSSSKSGFASRSRSFLNCSRVTACWKLSFWTLSTKPVLLMSFLSLSHLLSGCPNRTVTASNTSLTTGAGLLVFFKSCRLSRVTDDAHHLIVSRHSSSSACNSSDCSGGGGLCWPGLASSLERRRPAREAKLSGDSWRTLDARWLPSAAGVEGGVAAEPAAASAASLANRLPLAAMPPSPLPTPRLSAAPPRPARLLPLARELLLPPATAPSERCPLRRSCRSGPAATAAFEPRAEVGARSCATATDTRSCARELPLADTSGCGGASSGWALASASLCCSVTCTTLPTSAASGAKDNLSALLSEAALGVASAASSLMLGSSGPVIGPKGFPSASTYGCPFGNVDTPEWPGA